MDGDDDDDDDDDDVYLQLMVMRRWENGRSPGIVSGDCPSISRKLNNFQLIIVSV